MYIGQRVTIPSIGQSGEIVYIREDGVADVRMDDGHEVMVWPDQMETEDERI